MYLVRQSIKKRNRKDKYKIYWNIFKTRKILKREENSRKRWS